MPTTLCSHPTARDALRLLDATSHWDRVEVGGPDDVLAYLDSWWVITALAALLRRGVLRGGEVRMYWRAAENVREVAAARATSLLSTMPRAVVFDAATRILAPAWAADALRVAAWLDRRSTHRDKGGFAVTAFRAMADDARREELAAAHALGGRLAMTSTLFGHAAYDPPMSVKREFHHAVTEDPGWALKGEGMGR